MFAPTVETLAPQAPQAVADEDPWMTPEDVVAALSGAVTVRQVRGWISRGVLQGTHPTTGVWLVRRSAYVAWLEGGMRRTRPDAKPRGRRLAVPDAIEPARVRARTSRRAAATTELRLT